MSERLSVARVRACVCVVCFTERERKRKREGATHVSALTPISRVFWVKHERRIFAAVKRKRKNWFWLKIKFFEQKFLNLFSSDAANSIVLTLELLWILVPCSVKQWSCQTYLVNQQQKCFFTNQPTKPVTKSESWTGKNFELSLSKADPSMCYDWKKLRREEIPPGESWQPFLLDATQRADTKKRSLGFFLWQKMVSDCGNYE